MAAESVNLSQGAIDAKNKRLATAAGTAKAATSPLPQLNTTSKPPVERQDTRVAPPQSIKLDNTPRPVPHSDVGLPKGGIPAGWDAQTYSNFKKANPTLEPNAQDTQKMQQAGNPAYINKNVSQKNAQGMAQGIYDIRNAQNTQEAQAGQAQTPLASTQSDSAAIIKARGQVTPTGTPAKPGTTPAATTQGGTGTTPTPPTPADVTAQAQNGQVKSNSLDDQLKALQDSDLAGEKGYEDAVMKTAMDKDAANQAALDNQEAIAAKTLADKNAALQSSSEIQRQDAQNAADAATAELELQRKRTEQSYQDTIVEQKVQNTKRVLDQESAIAALGGFGSKVKNDQVMQTTLENDRLMNTLAFNKNADDMAITGKIIAVTKDYQTKLAEIETTKQNSIQSNYDTYLDYVSNITKDREMSTADKASAINEAQAKYKQNVAKINHDAFTERYDYSQKAAAEARTAQNAQRDDARLVLKDILSTWALGDDADLTADQKKQLADLEQKAGYPVGISISNLKNLKQQAKAANLQIMSNTNNAGDVTFYAVDKTTGKVVNQQTLQGIGASSKYTLTTDDMGNTIVFDPATGKVITNGSDPNIQTYTTGGKVPAGSTVAGGKMVSTTDANKIFKVGSVGGWCGVWASTMSTAPMVGNSWQEKLAHVDKRDNPKAGDKLVLPLGVSTDGSGYGHVVLTTGYDPETDTITGYQSNADGAINKCQANGGTNCEALGKVTQFTAKLSDLKKKYGNNFGFVSGDLKPGVQAQLDKAEQPMPNPISQGGGNNVSSMSDQDILAAYEKVGKVFDDPKSAKQAIAAARQTGFLPTPKEDKAAAKDAKTADTAVQTAKDIMAAYSGLKLTDLPTDQRAAVAKELNKLKADAFKSGDTLGVIRASAGGKDLDNTTLQSLEKALSVKSQLEDLSSQFAAGSTKIGDVDVNPIFGVINSNNPYNTKAQELKAKLRAIVPSLARGIYGEVGVLTDSDIDNYSKTIANLTSTQEVNDALTKMTQELVLKSIKTKLMTQAQAGRDVSGFDSLLMELDPSLTPGPLSNGVKDFFSRFKMPQQQGKVVDSYGDYQVIDSDSSSNPNHITSSSDY